MYCIVRFHSCVCTQLEKFLMIRHCPSLRTEALKQQELKGRDVRQEYSLRWFTQLELA